VVKTGFPAKDRNSKLDKLRVETIVRMNHGVCMHFALQDGLCGECDVAVVIK